MVREGRGEMGEGMEPWAATSARIGALFECGVLLGKLGGSRRGLQVGVQLGGGVGGLGLGGGVLAVGGCGGSGCELELHFGGGNGVGV